MAEPTTTKDIIDIIGSLVSTTAIIVGATWAYFKFIRTREHYPKIEFNIDVVFVGRQDNKIIIEATATVENKGLVRHSIKEFDFSVLILKSKDPLTHDEKINHQLLFEKHNPGGLDRIKWAPSNWPDTFVDAGVKQHYTYLTSVPDNTTFISIHSTFHYLDNDPHTAQRTFAVTK